MHHRKSIAIIGSGISGLSCAYHLHNDFNITVFEKESSLGGHTDTHSLKIDDADTNIDSGFIVFTPEYYPNFNRMLTELGVESQVTKMSFSAHNRKTDLVYNATSLNRLFCQRRNIFNPRFYRMLIDKVRFYLTSKKVLASDDCTTSVSEYLSEKNYSKEFCEDHLYPMISALWSATPERVKQFPIRHLVEFLYKHGMLNLFSRPDWRVIKNGSKQYIEAISKQINCNWQLETEVEKIERKKEGVIVYSSTKAPQEFDILILATHADQALKLLAKPTENEQAILGKIGFEDNHVIVHTDENIMHTNKLSWASWNTEVPNAFNPTSLHCCTANYWMNSLQNLSIQTNVFTSLNSHQSIDPDKVLIEKYYSHPIFTAESVLAQKQKSIIDGQLNSFYVGAYWGWGFHEDGASSALQVSKLIKSIY